jgi:hypothetical protein
MNQINNLVCVLTNNYFKPGTSLDKKELINSGLPTNLETEMKDSNHKKKESNKKKKELDIIKVIKQYKNHNTKQDKLILKKMMNII